MNFCIIFLILVISGKCSFSEEVSIFGTIIERTDHRVHQELIESESLIEFQACGQENCLNFDSDSETPKNSPPHGRYSVPLSSSTKCSRNNPNCLREAMITLSLGVQTAGGVMTPILHRGNWIPTKKIEHFSTVRDDQSSVLIHIFEGERLFADDNYRLYTLELSNIPPMPRGVPQIEIIFKLDEIETLTVTATEKISGVQTSGIIPYEQRITDDDEVSHLVQEAKERVAEDLNRLNEVFMSLLKSADGQGQSTDIEKTMVL